MNVSEIIGKVKEAPAYVKAHWNTPSEGEYLSLKEMAAFEEAQKLCEQKKLNLVIDSSSIQIKILDAPRLNQKKLLQYVKGEFPEIENPDDMVFDYSALGATAVAESTINLTTLRFSREALTALAEP